MACLSGSLVSSASVQKLFCGICSVFECSFGEFVGGESGLPVLFLCHLRTAALNIAFNLLYEQFIYMIVLILVVWEINYFIHTYASILS